MTTLYRHFREVVHGGQRQLIGLRKENIIGRECEVIWFPCIGAVGLEL